MLSFSFFPRSTYFGFKWKLLETGIVKEGKERNSVNNKPVEEKQTVLKVVHGNLRTNNVQPC